MKIDGHYETGALEVYVDGKYLDPRPSLKVWNHSPTGFGAGYGGSGPAQLALAILLLVTDRENAVRLHQDFKWDFVTKWSFEEDFEVNIDVADWINHHA